MKFFGRCWRVTIFRPDGSAIDPVGDEQTVNLDPLSINPATAIEIVGVAGSGLPQPRMSFSVEKKSESNPNTCDMKMYNLNAATRALLKQDPISVKLEVGHDSVFRQLFVGDVQYSDSILNDVTWETKIQLKDGGRSYREAFHAKTYSAGTRLVTVLEDLAGSLGVSLPPNVLTAKDLSVQIPKSLTIEGPTRDELTRQLAPFGYGWSFQNGLLQILKDTDVREDYAFVVEEEQAMVGTPFYAQAKKKGGTANPKLSFKTLIWPELLPGSKVDLRAREVRGLHKLIEVKHTGDTDEDDWYTSCEARQL